MWVVEINVLGRRFVCAPTTRPRILRRVASAIERQPTSRGRGAVA